jgi:Holliday junction resolvasome RuvABC DNA-binding subunit
MRVAHGRAHVGASSRDNARADAPTKLDVAIVRTQAKEALVGLGWKSVIAQVAVTAASAALGAEVTLDRLIFEALRQCPRPTS